MKKTCPRCAALFDCREDYVQSCSCSKVKLNAGVYEYIKENYGGCLCNTCLEATNTYFFAFSINPKYVKNKIK